MVFQRMVFQRMVFQRMVFQRMVRAELGAALQDGVCSVGQFVEPEPLRKDEFCGEFALRFGLVAPIGLPTTAFEPGNAMVFGFTRFPPAK
jgi:hypothetical protein